MIRVSGVPVATFNGVWPERADASELDVAEALARVADTGLPYCLQLRPQFSPSLAAVATSRGMVLEESMPLMVLKDPSQLTSARDVDDLDIRQLEPSEASLHARTVARAFDGSDGELLDVFTPAMLQLPGVRCYVGELDGQVVASGMGVTLGPSVAILGISTDPRYRGRGLGSALTAHAIIDGLDHGAHFSILQSSPDGFNVYRRLGFTTIEDWDVWVSTP